MDIKKILSACDHTLLSRTATPEMLAALCAEGLEYGVASVCIPPCFVAAAAKLLGGRLPVCTVIGFPNGYSVSEVKGFEAKKAIADGADEIDAVVNLTSVAANDYAAVSRELELLRRVTDGHILKIIIETGMLNTDQKIALCKVVTNSGADFIKTSTGFGCGGATREDIILMHENCGKDIRIKASGGISSLADAEDFLALGASRLGTSRLVGLAREAAKK